MSNSPNTTISGPLNGTACHINGNSDMYGRGIRIGFYLQWFSSIIAGIPIPPRHSGPPIALAPGESENTTFGLVVFIIATFLALLKQAKELAPVEIYILLLLIFGYHYYWVPDSIIRAIMCCTSTQMLIKEKPHGLFYLLVVNSFVSFVAIFQIWFWVVHFKPGRTGIGQCQQFGFSFMKINLENRGFRGYNIAYSVFLLLWSFGDYVLYRRRFRSTESGAWMSSTSRSRRSRPRRRHESQLQFCLGVAKSIVRFVLISIIISAIELSITWNKIGDVQSLSSAGQSIPFILGLATLSRVIWISRKTLRTEISRSRSNRWPSSDYLGV